MTKEYCSFFLLRLFRLELLLKYLAAAVILWPGCVSAVTLQDSISAYAALRGYKPSQVCVVVKEIDSDSPIVSINAGRPCNPASVSKLITASAALDLLGPGYRFTTTVYCAGKFNRDSGVVDGDLWIRGTGDPGFLAERLWLFVQHLSHLGVKKISRDLVLDDCYFDSEATGPGFDEDKSSRAYEAPTGALSASFNTLAIHVAPGAVPGSPIHIHPFPAVSGVKIISTALTTAPQSPSELQVKTEQMDGKTAILVYGGMRVDEAPRYIYRKVWQTWENFGWAMQGLFNECGIVFEGRMRRACMSDSMKALEPFYTFDSEPLLVYIGHMFKLSSNFAAEMLFKTIAAEKIGPPGSWAKGSNIINEWWKNNGLPGEVTIRNGSGMGNGNRISALQTTALLERAFKAKATAPDFLSALSIAGVDGTLEKRFNDSRLKGIIRAKTGTLNNYGVSTLAGFALLKKSTWVFAVFINEAGADQYKHWETQQKILEMTIPAK